MGDLDDSFSQLLGRHPSDKEKQDLYRVRDALKLKATDSVWLLLMGLQHYQTLYEQFPARIAVAARDVTKAVHAAAEAQAKAAQEETKKALIQAVHQAAVKSGEDAAGAQLVKWVSIAAGVICVALVLTGWRAFGHGQEKGKAVGRTWPRKSAGRWWQHHPGQIRSKDSSRTRWRRRAASGRSQDARVAGWSRGMDRARCNQSVGSRWPVGRCPPPEQGTVEQTHEPCRWIR